MILESIQCSATLRQAQGDPRAVVMLSLSKHWASFFMISKQLEQVQINV
jgi:hypothetical protein